MGTAIEITSYFNAGEQRYYEVVACQYVTLGYVTTVDGKTISTLLARLTGNIKGISGCTGYNDGTYAQADFYQTTGHGPHYNRNGSVIGNVTSYCANAYPDNNVCGSYFYLRN